MTDGSSKAGRSDELVEKKLPKNCPTHFLLKLLFPLKTWPKSLGYFCNFQINLAKLTIAQWAKVPQSGHPAQKLSSYHRKHKYASFVSTEMSQCSLITFHV
jgi:hypothetical protein